MLPVPYQSHEDLQDIRVEVGEAPIRYAYRIEELPWASEPEELAGQFFGANQAERLLRLHAALAAIEEDWELVQILTPAAEDLSIFVIYRKLITPNYATNQGLDKNFSG